jgi:hypothetical protein
MKDFQKQDVYRWQHAKFGSAGRVSVNKDEMTPEACTALVEDICRCYGVKVPEMIYPEGYQSDKSKYSPANCSITLMKWARRRYLIIHEVAHHIHYLTGNEGCSHGPEYFSIFAYLISEYMSIPLYEIFHKAASYGLKYASVYPKFKEGQKPGATFVGRYS